METTTVVITEYDTIALLEHIDTGVTLQVHLMYLLIAILFAYGLYRIYTYVFRSFF